MTRLSATELSARLEAGDLDFVDRDALKDWLTAQRWFGAKSDTVDCVDVLAAPLIAPGPPALVDALVEVRAESGARDLYQVPLAFGEAAEAGAVVASGPGWSASDAVTETDLVTTLMSLLSRGEVLAHGESRLRFEPVEGEAIPAEPQRIRPMGSEQSNTSQVVDESLVLKLYRRLEAGPNPELELLAFFARHGFERVPQLAGWVAWEGLPLETTLAVVQRYVPSEGDGWEATVASLAAGDDATATARLRRLGEVTGDMHAVLATDREDPAFAPEDPEQEALALLAARIEGEIEETFRGHADDERLGELPRRAYELREHVGALSHSGSFGRTIRIHGDYHLGQVVWDGDDWTVLDFEGEPARSLVERRQKRSPLRDVAGMLRSFSYAVEAAARAGRRPPGTWEQEARAAFLAGYRERIDASGLLPPGEDALARLLRVFELQKAVYELRYELDNRPDWIAIPVATITRLLDDAAA